MNNFNIGEIPGHNIKIRRKILGITQESLGKKIGVSRSAIGSYEENRALPDVWILYKMATLFGLTIEQLIGKAPYNESDFEVECNTCKKRYNNHVGSTECCGSIAWVVEKDAGKLWRLFNDALDEIQELKTKLSASPNSGTLKQEGE